MLPRLSPLRLAILCSAGLTISVAAAQGPAEPCALSTTTMILESAGPEPTPTFGRAVSVDGAWLAVGAPGNAASAGRVEMFHRVDGTWTHHSILVPAGSAADDRFGWSVSLDGHTLVVGATRATGAAMLSGAAHVFELVGDVWEATATLVAPDGQLDDRFGFAVSISGDVAVIGAISHDAVASDAGAAYVFHRSERGWALAEKLLDPDGESNDQLGVTVAVDGDIIAVASPFTDASEVHGKGTVFIHERSWDGERRGDRDGGRWVRTAALRSPDPASGAVGRQLDLRAGTVLTTVGHTGTFLSPVGLIFTRVDGAWTSARYISSPHGEFDVWGQRSMALSPDAGQLVWATSTFPMAVNLAWRDADEWTTEHVIEPPAGFPISAVGRSAAFDGATVVGGATQSVSSGRVFVSTVPGRDRDHDGLDDACELANGLDEDCDDDGVIDSAQRPFRFMGDTAPEETSWYVCCDDEFVILNGFTTAGDQMVRNLQWHRPTDAVEGEAAAAPSAVLVYIDHDHDGNPVNAELISMQPIGALPTEPGWVLIPMEPVALGPAGTSFFIGLLFVDEGEASISGESSVPHRQTSWFAAASELDPTNLAAANLRPFEVAATGANVTSGVVLLRAELSDCDGSDRLDLCEIADGSLVDSDGDGVPDVCVPGFDPHDLDGDGSVGLADLAILVSLWGPCPAAPAWCGGDFDGDGVVGGSDLGSLLAAWSEESSTL